MAHHFTHVFLLVYAGLFPIVNPVGNAPIFLALTRYCADSERHALALRVAINGFFLLLGSLFAGTYVLEFFGITLPVLRIAGGLVVTAFGWTLLQAKEQLGDQRTAETARGPDAVIDAFYPLTHRPVLLAPAIPDQANDGHLIDAKAACCFAEPPRAVPPLYGEWQPALFCRSAAAWSRESFSNVKQLTDVRRFLSYFNLAPAAEMHAASSRK